MSYSSGIITISDKGFKKEREDKSGPKVEEILIKNGFNIESKSIVPDEIELIEKKLKYLCVEKKLDLIITTGGTGFAERDVTPEATLRVVQKLVPGISEAIRAYSMTITNRAMLSRAISGICNETLIVNLPGSPKAVEESLAYIIDTVKHGLDILKGTDSECAKL